MPACAGISRGLWKSLPCGILVVNREGMLRMMNSEARRLLANGAERDRVQNRLANEDSQEIPRVPETLRHALDELRLERDER